VVRVKNVWPNFCFCAYKSFSETWQSSWKLFFFNFFSVRRASRFWLNCFQSSARHFINEVWLFSFERASLFSIKLAANEGVSFEALLRAINLWPNARLKAVSPPAFQSVGRTRKQREREASSFAARLSRSLFSCSSYTDLKRFRAKESLFAI